jgi:alpha,alpha-trehalase
MATVAAISDPIEKTRVLSCLSSIAESGWDFSSRWLEDPNSRQTAIIDKIVPSDLNALLGLQESYLASLSGKLKR